MATIPIETLPLAAPVGAGDYQLIVQGNVLKRMPPVRVITGAIGASPVTIDMNAQGMIGPFLLNLALAALVSMQVEISRDNGASYQQIGAAPWSTDLSIQFTKAPTDTSHVTHVRFTRTAGSATTSVYTLTNGFVAFTGAQNEMIGVLRSKILVVDAITRIGNVDPVNDRGFVLESQGIDINYIAIRRDEVAAWDRSKGYPCFGVYRSSNGVPTVVSGGTMRGTVANQAGRLALVSAQLYDYCQQIDNLTYYYLSGPDPTVNANWTALPAGQTAPVLISNPVGFELVQGGPIVVYFSPAPNVWIAL